MYKDLQLGAFHTLCCRVCTAERMSTGRLCLKDVQISLVNSGFLRSVLMAMDQFKTADNFKAFNMTRFLQLSANPHIQLTVEELAPKSTFLIAMHLV